MITSLCLVWYLEDEVSQLMGYCNLNEHTVTYRLDLPVTSDKIPFKHLWSKGGWQLDSIVYKHLQ